MSGNGTAKTSLESSPFRFLLILIPFAVATIIGACTMGMGDAKYVLWWSFALMLIGFTALPLAAKIWDRFSSGGFLLSQPLGLILSSLILWALTHLKLFRLNVLCIVLTFAIVAACCYIPKTFRTALIEKLNKRGFIESVVIEETLFLVIFFLMCYFKGFLPDINGQEKYMDYGFVMSMLRNDRLPANDMWLSGQPINYYYFGQFIWTVVIKITGVPTGIGYNIAMCSATAIPFGMSFVIGKYLIEASEMRGFRESKIIKYIAGFFTGCAVSLWGNSHSFFYDEESFGNGLLATFSKWGAEVGKTDGFFYPDSTRYIGWNPVVDNGIGGDYTIEEFPFYSFLVGDLHAHVISMIIVLLITAVILSIIASVQLPTINERINAFGGLTNLDSSKSNKLLRELKSGITLPVVLCAVLLGCAQMTNYWDFLIYFVFCAMGTLVFNVFRSPKFTDVLGAIVFIVNIGGILFIYLAVGDKPAILFALEALLMVAVFFFCVAFPSALPRTSFHMSFLFTVATLVALPFNLNFDMISNSLGKVKDRSSFYQLFILYGTHVIISVFFFIIAFASKNYKPVSSSKHNKMLCNVFGEDELRDYFVRIGEPLPADSNNKSNASANSYTEDTIPRNPIQIFLARRNLIDIFVCGMTVVGLMLIAAPEIFYVRDIYTGGYLRSNTMFKFAFAAIIILSITMIYSVVRLFWIVNKEGKYSTAFFLVAIFFALLLAIPAHYTMRSLEQRSGELVRANYKTLDGTAYIENFTSSFTGHYDPELGQYVQNPNPGNLVPYKECIDWFNTNVEGSPVICEAYGDSYTDNCIVSAYTGLPTVFGWQTHEWLWRFHGIVDEENDILVPDPDPEKNVFSKFINPRHNDINVIYLNSNIHDIQTIINRYNIEYIVIGDMERYKYSYDNSAAFAYLGTVAYSNEGVTVYKVDPSVTPDSIENLIVPGVDLRAPAEG